MTSHYSDLCRLVGIPTTTPMAEVVDAVREALEEAADPPPTAVTGPGVVAIDQEVYAALQRDAEHGRGLAGREALARRTAAVDSAVMSGRITAARRSSWLAAVERNPDAVADLEGLPAGAAVPTVEIGSASAPAAHERDGWFPGMVHATVAS